MSIKIPEIELVNILKNYLKGLKADYDERTIKEESVIGQMFYGVKYDDDKYDLFTQAVELLITRSPYSIGNSERKLTVHSYYNKDKTSAPTMHVACPSEEESENWFAGGLEQSGIVQPVGMEDFHYEQKVRRYKSSHAIIFTSDNHLEIQIMYFAVKYGLLSIFDTLILDLFQNPHITGHELQQQDTAGPEHFFSRSLIISASNEQRVSNFQLSANARSIMFPRSNDISGGHIGDPDMTIIINEGN